MEKGITQIDLDNLEFQQALQIIQYTRRSLFLTGKAGTGEACRQSVTDLGLDYWSVQHMANALAQGYGQVAQDVIDLKYGNGSARFKALVNAGYDPRMVQQIVNGMLLDD